MSDTELTKAMPGWKSEGILGSGAFGTAYLVRKGGDGEGDGAFGAMKVIKVPPAREAIDNAVKLGIGRDLLTTYFGKFKNDLTWELTMYKTVKSPHLAPVEDFATEDAQGPGWTGYIRTGIYTPLATYFDKTKSTPEDAARMGLELSSALEALEHYTMVHGDIKPGNVMVTDAGSFVLTDFGIRRCLEKAGSGIFGVDEDEFEAPELGQERNYTPLSDIYSLGALMCYVANGCSMPQNRDPGLIKGIGPAFAAVIRKAMAAEPGERYQTAALLRQELERTGLGKKSARRAMAAAAAFDAVKQNGGAVLTGAAVTVAAAAKSAGAAGANGGKTNKRPENKPAAKQANKPSNKPAERKPGNNQPGKTGRKPAEKRDEKPTNNKPAPATGATVAKADSPSGSKNADTVKKSGAKPYNSGAKRSKAGIIIGVLAALLIIAVVVMIWLPREDNKLPANSDEDLHGVVYPNGMDPEDLDKDGQNDQNGQNGDTDPEDSNGNEPGDPDGNATPDGNTDPDGNTTPDGNTQPDGDSPDENTQPDDNNGQDKNTSPDSADPGENTEPDGNTAPEEPVTRPEAVNNDTLYPSSTQRITREELEGKTKQETNMLINEIYARHGYIFGQGGQTQTYFNSQKWYTPVTSNAEKVVAQFNAIENANIKTLTDYAREMGWRGGTSKPAEPTEPTEPTTPDEPETPTEPTTPDEPATPDTPEEPGAEPTDNTIIFPSDTQLVTRADLEGRGQREVTLMLNEVFARHGYIFRTDYIREYFESQQWYTPVTSSESVVTGTFNETEKANVSFIDAYMHEMGWRK